MGRTFEDFIARTNAAETPEEVFHLYQQALAALGFDRVIYSRITDHPSLGVKAGHGLERNYPEDWMAHYAASGYERKDPVPRFAFKTADAFTWDWLVAHAVLTDEERRVMNEAAEAGLRDGVGIPLYGPNGEIAGIGLANATGDVKPDKNLLGLLKAMAAQFHIAYSEKCADAHDGAREIRLSAREREILLWVAEGKSDQVIADMLHISYPTVRFHLANIYRKLGANERIFAVAKALRQGLITPNFVEPIEVAR
ncbi:MAG: LuxR family transcriptional regulator [Betaproteobacteria bacterium]|nr:LuxR family transcriptional regulator [Betaproteobacteria bacterium]